MQISGPNREHKHSEIERFLMLNERRITQNSKSLYLSTVSKFSDVH